MNQFPIIHSERLEFKQLSIDDTADLLEYFSQDIVTEYMDIPSLKTTEEIQNLIHSINSRVAKGEGLRWAISIKGDNTNKTIGTCGIHNISTEHSRAEVGYELNPLYWGKGYATEAVKAVRDFVFNDMKLHRFEAFIDPVNDSSRNVLTKSGLKTEGILRDYFFEKGRFVDAELLACINPNDLKIDK